MSRRSVFRPELGAAAVDDIRTELTVKGSRWRIHVFWTTERKLRGEDVKVGCVIVRKAYGVIGKWKNEPWPLLRFKAS